MSNSSRFLVLTGMLLFLLCTASARADYVDPPERVARMNFSQGDVSFSPAGENDWVGVVRNRPLFRGDRLWSDYDSLAEFQVGSAAVRLGSNTSLEILDLDDKIAQFQLTEGTLNLSVRRLYPAQIFEVDTPTLAFTLSREGRYRIDVDPNNNVTTIQIREGAGVAYGENTNFPMIAGDNVRFYDSNLQDYELYGLPREDAFDRYCLERDRLLARSASLRYLDDDVVGYADLDEYGTWRPVSSYGTVWFPSRVSAGWAPYRDGHWIWQEPWGWTWVDNAPWGFAPSHYGRWVHVSNRWGWIPGPRHVRPVYAPALVAFIGGSNWSLSISTGSPIGWFPLGPREVYVPSYHASRDYFHRVNVNNTVVNNITITNVYNNYSSGAVNIREVNYVNRKVAGAVTAVPRNVFMDARPVRQAAIQLDPKAVTSGQITRLAPIAPSTRSVIGAGTTAKARPAREAFDRKVLVRNTPPPSVSPFSAREPLLQKNPGRAPDPNSISRNAISAPNWRVIAEQRGMVDARSAGSRRTGDKPSVTPGQLRPLDRSTNPVIPSRPTSGSQTRDKVNNGQGNPLQQGQAQRQPQAAPPQPMQRQPQAASPQPEQRQPVATPRQPMQRQPQAASPQLERRQLQATPPQPEQRQPVAAPRQPMQRQPQAASPQLERRQLQATPPQPEQRQPMAAPPQSMQRQPMAAPPQMQQQAAPQQQGKSAAKTQTPQEKQQAECERQAIMQHRDPKQCLTKTQTQDKSGEPKGNPLMRR